MTMPIRTELGDAARTLAARLAAGPTSVRARPRHIHRPLNSETTLIRLLPWSDGLSTLVRGRGTTASCRSDDHE